MNNNHLLKTLSHDTVTMKVRTSTYEFGRDIVHSIAHIVLSTSCILNLVLFLILPTLLYLDRSHLFSLLLHSHHMHKYTILFNYLFIVVFSICTFTDSTASNIPVNASIFTSLKCFGDVNRVWVCVSLSSYFPSFGMFRLPNFCPSVDDKWYVIILMNLFLYT